MGTEGPKIVKIFMYIWEVYSKVHWNVIKERELSIPEIWAKVIKLKF